MSKHPLPRSRSTWVISLQPARLGKVGECSFIRPAQNQHYLNMHPILKRAPKRQSLNERRRLLTRISIARSGVRETPQMRAKPELQCLSRHAFATRLSRATANAKFTPSI